ncbi:MAG: hypothetical protein HC824_07960 [Synechococcales cyanobacterium RM1_1_8]|nr:hypothetical protein [Synechococcales cyanobacterium RM1_1_8]
MVQERFYSLLKQRFQRDMEAQPPLFPWETELLDYEDGVAPGWAAFQFWQPKLSTSLLPVALPQEVMAQLFEKCQALVKSTAKNGRRLVEAVEVLFPSQGPALNALAGSVLLGPSRDGEGLAVRLLGSQIPEAYDLATPEQQMALVMVAAHEMLSRLTLKLSESEPSVSQSWETTVGRLHLHAAREGNCLRLEAQLPVAGTVELRGDATHTAAERGGAGVATLMVADVQPDQAFQVKVSLVDSEAPLGFTIQIQ